MEISEAQKKSFEILNKINKKLGVEHDPKWMFLSLVEEVGEAARELSRQQEGYRGEFNKEELADELSDIVSRTLVIAEDNNINLEEAFIKKLDKIKKRFELD